MVFTNICVDAFALLTATFAGVIGYYMWCFKYWERRNVPYLSPSFPFGTMTNPLFELEALTERIRRQYLESRKAGHKHVGLFNFLTPVYMPIDQKYIENILTKDFKHFVDRGIPYNESNDPSSANLFFVEGEKWHNLRAKLKNVFTPSNSKIVFPVLLKCSDHLRKAVDDVASNQTVMDVRGVVEYHVIDVMFTCIFGVECNSFAEPNSDIVKNIHKIFISTKKEKLKDFLFGISPKLSRLLGFRFVPKEPTAFFTELVTDTVKYRRQANFTSNDFLQILIDTTTVPEREDLEQHKEETLTMDELVAQLVFFFIAGYETLTTTVVFCLLELALNQDIQQKLREEIKTLLMKCSGTITYEAILKMVYMDAVLKETMRKYPATPLLNRRCTQEYKIPGTNIIIEQGTDLIIPIAGLHYDAVFYPNPGNFLPERFNQAGICKRDSSTYIPFGHGPKICLGVDFALIQMKLALVVFLENYSFSLSNKTQLPLKLNPFSIVLNSVEPIWLDVTYLNK